jgi:diguanylate cyclase
MQSQSRARSFQVIRRSRRSGLMLWLAIGTEIGKVRQSEGETGMLSSSESSRIPIQAMERLSEVILESLQELASANHPLSTTSLCRALATKRELHDLIARSTAEDSHPVNSQMEERIHLLEGQLQKTLDHEKSLQSHVLELEERIADTLAFQKKSTAALVILARKRKDKKLATQLERFKSLIMSDADLLTLDECLQEIKQIVISEPEQRQSGTGSKNSIAAAVRALSGTAGQDAVPREAENFLPQVQKAFLTILGQFTLISGEQNFRRFLDLEQRIKNARNMEALLALGPDLIEIIHDYVGYTSDERSQVAHFVTELGKNLLDMESQLKVSISDAQESYVVNQDFNNAMQGQVEDIKDSFSFDRTLDEIRGFVLAKVKAIRTALERKRKQDELQLDKANKKMADLQSNLLGMKAEIDQVHKRTKVLEEEVQLDSLIGIHNRRAYEIRMQEELQRFQRYNQTFSLVMFDVDHFKQVNDQHGHRAGDKCLIEIVNRIKPSLRKSDFLARYGGEEFVVILAGTPKANAYKLAEKLRLLIEKTRFGFQGRLIPVTISLGVTEVCSEDRKPEDIFARVDEAMYNAKRGGRNRVALL